MPPSPWLSARITNVTYLTDTARTSAQRMREMTPNQERMMTIKPVAAE